ncbi:MAG: DNA repair protein RecN [Bacteroidia bacterium]|nr:DNA repair protein RecN [Bacteroidia bacterium]
MLQHLYLRNYALFAETQVDFQPGLNILTGETGAGKSLLVGALGLIMGKRLDNSALFMGDGKCVIEARFARLSPALFEGLEVEDAFDLDGDELIIRREITASGKSRAFINDTPVSLQTLREVSALLLDLHGQHENQLLLAPDQQLRLLDAYAGTEALAARFGEALRAADATLREIRTLEAREAEARRQLDFVRFQVGELEAAGLRAQEETELEQELNLLQHSEDVREGLGAATETLYNQELSLYAQLSAVIEGLRKVVEVNAQVAADVQRLSEMRDGMKEISFQFQHLLDAVESDPERLAFIEERLSVYHRMKLKYQVRSGAELIALLEQLRGQMQEADSMETQIAELKQRYAAQQDLLRGTGLELERLRLAAKPVLEERICDLLLQVGFQKARFEAALERTEDPNGTLTLDGQRLRPLSSGFNRVYFLIQPNPGLPPGPLSQIASGGEISRVMLAIKTALAEKFQFPVLIFDEIDTGISGEIANKVGQVMQQLARRFQILSITHLPQIAAKGDQHYQIRKLVQHDSTVSTVAPLSREERIRILAQMLSGDQPTESALRNAEELMGAA